MKKMLAVAIATGALAAACAQNPATTTTATPAAQPQAAMAGDSGMRGMHGMGGEGHRGMRGEDHERMEAMMFKGITLSASQKAQLDSIRARHHSEMEGKGARPEPGDHDKMKATMQAHMAEVRAVLTPEQQAVFDKNMKEMHEHEGEHHMGGGAPPRE